MDHQISDLEDQVELLRQQLEAVTGSPREIGALMSLRCGMTQRLAIMLFILVRRAPGMVSNNAFHSIIYGSNIDGGPDPKIFALHICRLRKLLRRLEIPGKIDTVWNAGYRANPKLVKWVNAFYSKHLPQEK